MGTLFDWMDSLTGNEVTDDMISADLDTAMYLLNSSYRIINLGQGGKRIRISDSLMVRSQ